MFKWPKIHLCTESIEVLALLYKYAARVLEPRRPFPSPERELFSVRLDNLNPSQNGNLARHNWRTFLLASRPTHPAPGQDGKVGAFSCPLSWIKVQHFAGPKNELGGHQDSTELSESGQEMPMLESGREMELLSSAMPERCLRTETDIRVPYPIALDGGRKATKIEVIANLARCG